MKKTFQQPTVEFTPVEGDIICSSSCPYESNVCDD